MKFVDRARIHVHSGAGGAGCVSFRREKFIEFGGPDGGDGGRGGHVWVQGSNALNTLVDFRYRPYYRAKPGRQGAGRNRTGASADDIVIDVPVGTQLFEEDEKEPLADLDRSGERVLLARGGNGGFGNARFKSSTRRAPRHANPGQPGESRTIMLHLKLIADAGIVGLPNAGKSTFLSVSSAAKPAIADYPFTTLYPGLGVVRAGPGESFVLADIPGLIRGAHAGAGIGHRFLGHIERCGVLLHLIDGSQDDLAGAYRTIREELAAYGAGLEGKTEVVALNKTDLLSADGIAAGKSLLERISGTRVHTVSSASGAGVASLAGYLLTCVEDWRRRTGKADETTGWHP